MYEWTPGFVHAKAFLSDDKVAGIGTVNLDYRSLFLHFECNSIFYKSDIVDNLKKDYIKTENECREIAINDIKQGEVHRFVDNIRRIIAPLL